MAANTDPIFSRAPNVQICGAIVGSAANTATNGTGANITSIFQADATEGSFVQSVTLKPISTIAATVARIWIYTATGAFTPGTSNTAANTSMIAEQTIQAFTASNSVAAPHYDIPINRGIDPGFRLLITFGTSTGASTTGFNPVTWSGKY